MNVGFENLINVFYFIIPGFIATEIYRSEYPMKHDTDFARLAWSVATSVLLFMFAALIDTRSSLGFLSFETAIPPVRTMLLFAGLTVWAGLLAIAVDRMRHKSGFSTKCRTWANVNSTESQWANVVLDDGSRYLGWISDWTYDPDESDADFLLSEARRVDENLNVIYEVSGKGVYLRLSSVRCIEFYR